MSSPQPAITVAEEVTSPGTARSRRRSESNCATTAGRLDTWRGIATTPTSRSATPAVASDTFRSAVKRSNATGELPARNVTAAEYRIMKLLSVGSRGAGTPHQLSSCVMRVALMKHCRGYTLLNTLTG